MYGLWWRDKRPFSTPPTDNGGDNGNSSIGDNSDNSDGDSSGGWFSNLINWFKERFQDIGQWFENLGNNIGNWFNDLWTNIDNSLRSLSEKIKDGFENIGNWFSNLGEGIKNFFTKKDKDERNETNEKSSVMQDKTEEVNGLVSGKFSAFYTVKDFLSDFWNTIQNSGSVEPNFNITLPEVAGGENVNVVDLSFYNNYRN